MSKKLVVRMARRKRDYCVLATTQKRSKLELQNDIIYSDNGYVGVKNRVNIKHKRRMRKRERERVQKQPASSK